MSTLRRRKLRRLIESEVKQAVDPRKKLDRQSLENIIMEEYETLISEGFFKGAAAAASRYLPGGGAALDYVRSQAFERIENRLDEIEIRLQALERRGSDSI